MLKVATERSLKFTPIFIQLSKYGTTVFFYDQLLLVILREGAGKKVTHKFVDVTQYHSYRS